MYDSTIPMYDCPAALPFVLWREWWSTEQLFTRFLDFLGVTLAPRELHKLFWDKNSTFREFSNFEFSHSQVGQNMLYMGTLLGVRSLKGRAQTTLHLLRQIEIRIPKDEIAHPDCLNSSSFDVFMDRKQFRINSAVRRLSQRFKFHLSHHRDFAIF